MIVLFRNRKNNRIGVEMDNVKALFFDEGGTVFDWKKTAREKIQELAKAAKVQWDGILSCC